VVQDSYLRWRTVDLSSVAHPRAHLAQIVTRQPLGVLRPAARRREEYVGPWLPEAGEAVTTAMLLVLETLTPNQRAVFVLCEVFDFSYSEIAAAIGKSEEAVRQLNQRARNQVHAERHTAVAPPSEAAAVTERFSIAASTCDVQGLMDVLAPDVVYLADGGGVVNAVRRPVRGPDKVARLVIGLFAKGARMAEIDVRFGTHNGMHSVTVFIDRVLDQVTSIEVGDGVVTARRRRASLPGRP
jgi:RNA polymerase sigma-70 factor (ECF subfamily)